MIKLADFIIKTADNCAEVRPWLQRNPDFNPLKLIVGIDSSEEDSDDSTDKLKDVVSQQCSIFLNLSFIYLNDYIFF